MGIDACVLLRIRDADAFAAALAAKREFAGAPQHLGDGTVSVFSGIRFDDDDAPLVLRQWLHTLLGPGLECIRADVRGVFVYPGIAEPRARDYEAIVTELGGCGRFIDAAAPSEGELAAHAKKLRAEFAAIEAAVARGDAAAFAPPPIVIETTPAVPGDADNDDELKRDLGELRRRLKDADNAGAPEIDLGALLRRLKDADDRSS